jgi:hypothetical protein
MNVKQRNYSRAIFEVWRRIFYSTHQNIKYYVDEGQVATCPYNESIYVEASRQNA